MNTSSRTLSPRRRGTGLAIAATVCAVTLLTGCDGDSGGTSAPVSPTGSASAAPAAPAPATTSAGPAVPADKAFDPDKALAAASKKPYAANLTITTEADDLSGALTTSGRVNLNGPFTGRMEMKSAEPGPTMETVTTADATYVRKRGAAGAEWTKRPRTTGGNLASYEGYAKLLLGTGPSARKGMENQGGVATYHLSGYLTLEQIASVDPRTYTSMKAKGVSGFACDQWIDSQGRTIRFEQRFVMHGVQAANKATFGAFGPAEEFTAPTGG
ncbi:hypothetical protein DEJ50_02520 [Streptomyces venezuelae]|uniref:Lipoprotein n=1 Tax=Streptomyces venezuelae TaxID=54571 RepID=A0A5P2CX93_STRVZ|nr:hypothetical protein [Streptomyces venezuelae]QES46890.1 hypothetical protein DEJ50_02520 [Streptomyces venezuelae]